MSTHSFLQYNFTVTINQGETNLQNKFIHACHQANEQY